MLSVSLQAGYFSDFTHYPMTTAQAVTFSAGAPWIHNFYPGDETLDVALGSRRILYFFDSHLEKYSTNYGIDILPQIIANLKRFPKRHCYIISESNNTSFTSQAMTPVECAKAVRDYVHFIRTYCPDAEIYGPVVAQEGVTGITYPYNYLRDTFNALRQYPDGQQILSRLNLAINYYRQGADPVTWAARIEKAVQDLRFFIAAPFGMSQSIAMPEVGSPNGGPEMQDIIAGYVQVIQPKFAGIIGHWFCSPIVFEPGRNFRAGSTHYLDATGTWKLTPVGKALNLMEPNSNPLPILDRFDLALPLTLAQLAKAVTATNGAIVPLGLTQTEINNLISQIKAVKK